MKSTKHISGWTIRVLILRYGDRTQLTRNCHALWQNISDDSQHQHPELDLEHGRGTTLSKPVSTTERDYGIPADDRGPRRQHMRHRSLAMHAIPGPRNYARDDALANALCGCANGGRPMCSCRGEVVEVHGSMHDRGACLRSNARSSHRMGDAHRDASSNHLACQTCRISIHRLFRCLP